MAEKHQEILDLFDQNELDKAKSTTEQDLHKGDGKGKASRRDLRALIKTLWAINDEVINLKDAVNYLSENIDKLINRQ